MTTNGAPNDLLSNFNAVTIIVMVPVLNYGVGLRFCLSRALLNLFILDIPISSQDRHQLLASSS